MIYETLGVENHMHLNSVRPRRGPIRTPLRYPGGKSRLAGFFEYILGRAGWQSATYVEPYAGGAGAALSLLYNGTVSRLVINDLDPCIFAFWDTAVNHSSELLTLLTETPLSIDEWHRQREIYRLRDITNPLQLGFATFYLNRTNRSGVMNAGIIGGQAQAGKYRMDARFNKSELASRLAWIGSMSGSIQVSNRDGLDVLRETLCDGNAFAYIDPPYYEKGSFLYMNSFVDRNHVELAQLLRDARESRWVLTYDDVPEIRRLYRGLYQGTFNLPYSAHVANTTRERMVLSDSVAQLEAVMQ